MQPDEQPYVVGLPDEFDLTEDQAHALNVDAIVADAELRHGTFDASRRLKEAQRAADDKGDQTTVLALQMLIVACDMGLSLNRRNPFERFLAGTDGEQRRWHTPVAADLTDRHAAVLETLLGVISTAVVRGQVADVLWHRPTRRRNPEHARTAIAAHLTVAEQTFDPAHWVDSQRYLTRAHRVAFMLGPQSPEFAAVMTTARAFLGRLDGNDPLYYTERIVSMVLSSLNDAETPLMLDRIRGIAEQSSAAYDFERARTYYDLTVRLLQRLGREADVAATRITRAETFVAEATVSPNETQRAHYLRSARQALLEAGAPRERIAEIARDLDEAQRLAVSEMTTIPTSIPLGIIPSRVMELVRGAEPVQGLWLLAGLDLMPSREAARQVAEEITGRYHFHFGFGRRQVTRDGREQAEIPGTLGAGEEERESAIRGAMRDSARQGRILAAFGAIEPGRRQLWLQHEYTLEEIYEAVRHRPLIPDGHQLLWAKGVHAGLAGEYDIAVHLLAPQMENALREVLRLRGEVVYSTQHGFQRLWSVEDVLKQSLTMAIFGDQCVFTVDTVLGDRLGANVRNDVAHGIESDADANGVDSVYLWWLALNLLRFYGTDALAPTNPEAPPTRPSSPEHP
jgi:hypothetical protein